MAECPSSNGVTRVLGSSAPTTDGTAVALYVATDVVLCGGLLLLYVAMKRYTPRLLSPFIGGRL